MKIRKLADWLGPGRSVAVALVAVIGTLSAGSSSAPHNDKADGWKGISRKSVSIDLGRGWVTKGELSLPASAHKKLPLVVLLHGSGHNDMNSTLPDNAGSVFVPIAQTANREGFAVLRFNKRGVTGLGPTLTDDESQLYPQKPYEQVLSDAASVARFGASLPEVDPSRIYLLGHSEGTQVAANLAADPRAANIPKPAGVIAMGVVGSAIRTVLTYQLFGVRLAQLHEEFDVDGDGSLTRTEISDGLLGQPSELVTYYRDVLLSGDQVKPETDTDRNGVLLESGASPRKAFFFYRGTRLMAARVGPWKAHFMTQDGYGQPEPTNHDPPLLFNLEVDPSEKFDVAKDHPDVVEEIRRAASEHQAGVTAPPSQLELR